MTDGLKKRKYGAESWTTDWDTNRECWEILRLRPDGTRLVIFKSTIPNEYGEVLINKGHATLAASAPNLLNALRDCVAVMQRDLAGLEVIQPELRGALAAIEKATGEKA